LGLESLVRLEPSLEMDLLEYSPELGVGMFVEGVEVPSDGATEEDRILENDGDPGAKVLQTHSEHVQVVDVNGSGGGGFHEAEERGDQTGLPRPCPTHNPDLPQPTTQQGLELTRNNRSEGSCS